MAESELGEILARSSRPQDDAALRITRLGSHKMSQQCDTHIAIKTWKIKIWCGRAGSRSPLAIAYKCSPLALLQSMRRNHKEADTHKLKPSLEHNGLPKTVW